jgi:hypothetical protein
MATISDLGKEYAGYIRLNIHNPNVSTEMVRRINGLTYTETGEPLSNEDKMKLLDTIQDELIKYQTKRGISVKAEDSRTLIDIIDLIRKKMR